MFMQKSMKINQAIQRGNNLRVIPSSTPPSARRRPRGRHKGAPRGGRANWVPYEVYKRHRGSYFLKVQGRYISKVCLKDCYILIDPDMEPQNGSIAVVSIDGKEHGTPHA